MWGKFVLELSLKASLLCLPPALAPKPRQSCGCSQCGGYFYTCLGDKSRGETPF